MVAVTWAVGAALLVAVVGEITWQDGESELVVVVEEGVEEVILECPYVLGEDDEVGFTVQWNFDGFQYVLYQWIPSGKIKTPQITAWNDTIDTSYEASSEPLQRFSALRLRSPTQHHAGRYSCVASSFNGENTRHVRLIVYSLSSLNVTLDFEDDEEADADADAEAAAGADSAADADSATDADAGADADVSSGNVTVSCVTGPTFPRPRLELFRTCRHGSRKELEVDVSSSYFDFKYEVSVEAVLSREDAEEMTVECVLSIPHTNVTLTDSVSTLTEAHEDHGDDDSDRAAESRGSAPSSGIRTRPLVPGVAAAVALLLL